MTKHRFRFISHSFLALTFLLLMVPTVGISYFAWSWCKTYAIRHVERGQREIAAGLLDMVRTRYDLIQNYLYYKEETLRRTLVLTADTLHRTARELELETARRNLPLHRAQDVFVSIVADVSQKNDQHVSVFRTSGEIIYSPMLPSGVDMSDTAWIQAMKETDAGEFQFSWRYPGEAEAAERIMVFRLIHGWGWILSVEGLMADPFSDPFVERQYQGLKDYISGYHAPAGGVAMILSASDREVIAHPEMRGGSCDGIPGVSRIIAAKRGPVVFEDEHGYRRHAHVETFAPNQWVIAVCAREDQILQEAHGVFRKLIGVALALGLPVMLLFYRLIRAALFRSIARRRYSDFGLQ